MYSIIEIENRLKSECSSFILDNILIYQVQDHFKKKLNYSNEYMDQESLVLVLKYLKDNQAACFWLREIKEKIERSASMRVLYYKSWIQPIGSDQKSIMIRGEATQEENYEIEGFITLYRKRFLHVVTDLWFTKSATKNDEGINFSNASPREPVSASLVKDASNSSALKMFMMKQKRRVRANELHYLDHPAFGLVLKIKRFKKDEQGN